MEKLLEQVQEALESPDGFDNLDEVIEESINTEKGDLISTIVFERGFCDVTRRLNNLSENLITICSSDQSFDIPTFNKLLLTNINNIFSSSCSSLTDMKHLHLTADRTKKLYIVIKQTESFPSTTIDKIITTLYELKLPVILICCVSTNRDSLFLKCSRSNYLLLDIKYASVNSPEVIFDKIWSKIQLNKDIPFIFSNQIIDKARESYFNYSYSIKDIQKYLELSIAFHFNKINNGHVIIDKSNDFSSYKDAFIDTLLLLHDMTKGYYSQKSIWYLYSMIYSNDGNIFDNTDGTEFFRWLSVWNVWGREKFIECLENIEVIINESDCEFLKCLHDDLKMLLERLNTLDKRIEEETKNQQTKFNNIGNVEVKKANNKNKIRINKDERQRILRDKMEYKKNCDLFSKDKKDIFEFLSRFFKMTFSHMYSVKGFSYYFIENISFIQRLIDPPSDYYIDIDLNHLLNNSDQYFNLNTNDKLDVPLSYKLLQSLTNIHTTKPISIEKWKQAFINDCSSDERIDVRFRKTLKVLKQLRVIKDASENNVEKIVCLQHSYTFAQ
uniref:ORC3_N domain-containing protein n=1 Tax=Strongyloides papillosus TaxID=174720 RepID=A0A0N5BAN3_STREA